MCCWVFLAGMAIIGSVGEVRCTGIEHIATIVVIDPEDRSFDTLYGSFPGANGLSQNRRPIRAVQSRWLHRKLPRCGAG
jgi:phospholipase C